MKQEIPNIKLAVSQLLTLFSIDDVLAMTHRNELKIVQVLETPEFRPDYVNATRGKWRLGAYKQKGKRKAYYLDLKLDNCLLFEGWGLGVLTDGEAPAEFKSGMAVTSYAGNACFNLHGDPEKIKSLIDTAIIASDQSKAQIIVGNTLLYPEIETAHAVVNRMKESA